MRILLIIDGLPGGGAEKVVLTLAQNFLASGDQVTLFSLRNVCDYPLPSGIHYHIIADNCRAPWRKLTELSRRATMLNHAVIQAEQRQGKFDLVLSSLHKTDRIVARTPVLAERNLWFCLHGMFSASYLNGKRGISRWIKRQKIRQVYQQRNIVTVSHAVAGDLQREFGVIARNIKTIYNPFDPEHLRLLAQQPCEMAGQDYIIHVGRFHPTKRHDRLLHAYAQSRLNAPLVLLGQTSRQQEAKLRNLAMQLGIADKVLFKGFQTNPLPWIRHARLLVLSSDSEGFGNVLIEALIVGTPVVSTRCPGGPQEILTGEMACCLAALNSESLARVMQQIYHSPPAINPAILQRFSCQQSCESYRSLARITYEPDKVIR